MEVDYARYGVGEAMLGWVNARATLECRTPRVRFNPDVWLMELAQGIHRRLGRVGIEIAHLKLALDGGEAGLAAVQLTRSEGEPEAARVLGARIRNGLLLVNLRAEADPAGLERAVRAALRAATSPASGVKAGKVTVDAFRPGQPVPSHRVAVV